MSEHKTLASIIRERFGYTLINGNGERLKILDAVHEWLELKRLKWISDYEQKNKVVISKLTKTPYDELLEELYML